MPSIATLEKKQAAVAALTEEVQKAAAGVLVNYAGITVEQDTELRRTLRAAGVSYHVYKNSMTGRACEAAGYAEIKPYLEGMTALATCESDPIAPAKILAEFADKVKGFALKAGFVDGKVIDSDAVAALAKTPSREVMICQIMGGMMSSLYGLARVLQAKIDKENGVAVEA